MKILVLEYITGGGFKNEPIPESLCREGDLMLGALLNDLVQLDDMEISIFRDYRLQRLPEISNKHKIKIMTIHPEDDFDYRWASVLRQCDAVWPIAPETHGVLAKLSAAAESNGCILLNSSAKAIRLTGSKTETGVRCRKHGIAYVPSVNLEDFNQQFTMPWVIKPDDGVGCEGTRVIRTPEMLEQVRNSTNNDNNLIIQPLMPGIAESLSILCDGKNALLLSINQQIITIDDDRFTLSACRVNVADTGLFQYQRLIASIAQSFPGLWGYVGIDLITQHGVPKVLEINPRLTTPYAGLKAALGINTASMILDMIDAPLTPYHQNAYNRKSVAIELEKYHAP